MPEPFHIPFRSRSATSSRFVVTTSAVVLAAIDRLPVAPSPGASASSMSPSCCERGSNDPDELLLEGQGGNSLGFKFRLGGRRKHGAGNRHTSWQPGRQQTLDREIVEAGRLRASDDSLPIYSRDKQSQERRQRVKSAETLIATSNSTTPTANATLRHDDGQLPSATLAALGAPRTSISFERRFSHPPPENRPPQWRGVGGGSPSTSPSSSSSTTLSSDDTAVGSPVIVEDDQQLRRRSKQQQKQIAKELEQQLERRRTQQIWEQQQQQLERQRQLRQREQEQQEHEQRVEQKRLEQLQRQQERQRQELERRRDQWQTSHSKTPQPAAVQPASVPQDGQQQQQQPAVEDEREDSSTVENVAMMTAAKLNEEHTKRTEELHDLTKRLQTVQRQQSVLRKHSAQEVARLEEENKRLCAMLVAVNRILEEMQNKVQQLERQHKEQPPKLKSILRNPISTIGDPPAVQNSSKVQETNSRRSSRTSVVFDDNVDSWKSNGNNTTHDRRFSNTRSSMQLSSDLYQKAHSMAAQEVRKFIEAEQSESNKKGVSNDHTVKLRQTSTATYSCPPMEEQERSRGSPGGTPDMSASLAAGAQEGKLAAPHLGQVTATTLSSQQHETPSVYSTTLTIPVKKLDSVRYSVECWPPPPPPASLLELVEGADGQNTTDANLPLPPFPVHSSNQRNSVQLAPALSSQKKTMTTMTAASDKNKTSMESNKQQSTDQKNVLFQKNEQGGSWPVAPPASVQTQTRSKSQRSADGGGGHENSNHSVNSDNRSSKRFSTRSLNFTQFTQGYGWTQLLSHLNGEEREVRVVQLVAPLLLQLQKDPTATAKFDNVFVNLWKEGGYLQLELGLAREPSTSVEANIKRQRKELGELLLWLLNGTTVQSNIAAASMNPFGQLKTTILGLLDHRPYKGKMTTLDDVAETFAKINCNAVRPTNRQQQQQQQSTKVTAV